MTAVKPTSPHRPLWSGPAAGVLVALAGAALVVIALLLVGVREASGGRWMPAAPPMAQAS
jgi:hypothetical protein